jgi:hypothetical protein
VIGVPDHAAQDQVAGLMSHHVEVLAQRVPTLPGAPALVAALDVARSRERGARANAGNDLQVREAPAEIPAHRAPQIVLPHGEREADRRVHVGGGELPCGGARRLQVREVAAPRARGPRAGAAIRRKPLGVLSTVEVRALVQRVHRDDVAIGRAGADRPRPGGQIDRHRRPEKPDETWLSEDPKTGSRPLVMLAQVARRCPVRGRTLVIARRKCQSSRRSALTLCPRAPA